MRFTNTPTLRTALRPTLQRVPRRHPAHARRMNTGQAHGSGPHGEVGDKGTAKIYNKDGTTPNKNLVYLTAAVLGVGGIYAMFMSKPAKVADAAKARDPEGVAAQRAANSPPAR